MEEVLKARFVISAVGSLNLPRLPAIPGMESFAGPCSTPPAGPRTSRSREATLRWWARVPLDSRSVRQSVMTSNASRFFSGRPSGYCRTGSTTHPARREMRGPCDTCPFYGRGSDSPTTFSGCGDRHGAVPTETLTTRTPAAPISQCDTTHSDADLLLGVDALDAVRPLPI